MNDFNMDLEHVQKHVLTAIRLLNSFYREHLDAFADKNSNLKTLLLNTRPIIMGACATYFMSEDVDSALDCRMEALHLVLESDGRDLFDTLVLQHPYVQVQYDSKMNDLNEQLEHAHKQFDDKQNSKRWYHMRGNMDDAWEHMELRIQTQPLEKALRSKKLTLHEEGFETFIYDLTSQLCSMAQQSCSLVDQVVLEAAAKNEPLTVTVEDYVPSGDLKRHLTQRREPDGEYPLPRTLRQKI